MPSTYVTFEFSYNQQYDNPALRGIDDPRPWDLTAEIQGVASVKKSLLDIGCGSGLKLVEIADFFASITGLDHNPEMLKLAEERFIHHHVNNYSLITGTAKNLPFDEACFDVVTVMMAPHDVDEIYRVLKPDGILIIETLGEMDKRNLKNFFEYAPQIRGQLSNRPEGTSVGLYRDDLSPRYENVSIEEGFWNTYYTAEGLLALLMSTPTVLNFDPVKDKMAFDRALETLPQKNGLLSVRQHRLLIKAQKPSN